MATERVSVKMLHTERCPNAADYLPRLRQLAAIAGSAQPVLVRLIADPEQAQRERFLGSPTIRVDGRDVDPGADVRRDYGLSCRLYAGAEGVRGTRRLSGSSPSCGRTRLFLGVGAIPVGPDCHASPHL